MVIPMNKIYKVQVNGSITPKYIVCESIRDIYTILSQYFDYSLDEEDILSIELISDKVILESDFKQEVCDENTL